MKTASRRRLLNHQPRRGVVVVLATLLLVVLLGFVAFSLDTGLVSVTQTDMQVAVDSAALAASQEISNAAEEAAQEGSSIDIHAVAESRARDVAVAVAAANGVYIDRNDDVNFGRRVQNDNGTWRIEWGASPYNVVNVTARRDQPDTTAPDGQLQLAFGWAVGMPKVALHASGTAYVEARDIAVVLDYSASMNDDSLLDAADTLGLAAVEDNLRDIYEALGPPNVGNLPTEPQYMRLKGSPPRHPSMPQIYVTFRDTSIYVECSKDLSNVVLEFEDGARQKFDGLSGRTGVFQGTGGNSGRSIRTAWIKSGRNRSGDGPGYGERFEDTVANVRAAFNLDRVPFPYPRGSWDSFIEYCRSDSAVKRHGYKKKYGGLLLASYLMRYQPRFEQTPDLWKTPHYPFHAMKNGATLFTDFLRDLEFGDHIGLVTYDSEARIETKLDDPQLGVQVDLGSNPLTNDYASINEIQRHKQAGHYDLYTNIGDGVRKARELLRDHGRPGARPTILLMTDGQANRRPSGWQLPHDWNWDQVTDTDGDGVADYTTSNRNKQYAFYEAMEAIKQGATVHTMTVGAGADRDLMKAIAFAGGGIWVDVPGGSTIAEVEAQMLEAFKTIAAAVPPAKLVAE